VYERHDEPLLPRQKFIARFVRHGRLVAVVVLFSLTFGTLGFHMLAGQEWIDGLLNSAMLLGGMGPVGEIHYTAGKLFASFYALYAGIVFLGAAGLLVVPIIHRVLHKIHLEERHSKK
jgi:hypothetical protein